MHPLTSRLENQHLTEQVVALLVFRSQNLKTSFLCDSLGLSEELGAVVAVELPDHDEGKEDDVDGDPHQDGCVVRVGGDRLRPGGLAELVLSCVGSDLRKEKR